MDAIMQQKRKGEAQFRIQIDDFLSNSIFTKESQQLSPDVIQEIFSSVPKDGLFTNGKINLQKLMQDIKDSGCHFNTKQFQKIFGQKKEIKPQQLFLLLKSHQLTEFDLQEEIRKNFFQQEKLSVKKLDKVMKELKYPQLNKKDKDIMMECFDYDKNGSITEKNLAEMILKCGGLRGNRKIKNRESRENTQNKPERTEKE